MNILLLVLSLLVMADLSIYLRKLGDRTVNVTQFLSGKDRFIIDQVLERGAFQRSVEDVRLMLSNLFGDMKNFFGPLQPKDRVEMLIKKDEMLFRGEVARAVFDHKDEWVTVDAYSKTRIFWDMAKKTRIARALPAVSLLQAFAYLSLKDILAREITQARFPNVFVGIALDPQYANRSIRFWTDAIPGIVPDEAGRYRDLHPSTTVEELLKAMAVYYNAEFFIDPVTGNFTMARRNAVLRAVTHNIDELLLDKQSIKVEVHDESRVDYIGLNLEATIPDPPRFKRVAVNETYDGWMRAGLYRWLVTSVYQAGSLEVESGPSQPSEVIIVTSVGAKSFETVMTVPAVNSPAIRRNIYRTKNSGDGDFYFVASVNGKNEAEFKDRIPDRSLGVQAPIERRSSTVWIRYDEATGRWLDPIYDDIQGLNQPEGKVFEVTPQLRFVQPPPAETIKFLTSTKVMLNGVERTQLVCETAHRMTVGSVVRLPGNPLRPSLIFGRTVLKVVNILTIIVDGPTFSNTGGTLTRINDVVPESELVEKPFNITDAFAFFGRELDLQTYQNQWREMFLTKRPVSVSVKGVEYRVGDGVSWSKRPAAVPMGSRFLIKQARIDVTNETTQLYILEEKIPKPPLAPS